MCAFSASSMRRRSMSKPSFCTNSTPRSEHALHITFIKYRLLNSIASENLALHVRSVLGGGADFELRRSIGTLCRMARRRLCTSRDACVLASYSKNSIRTLAPSATTCAILGKESPCFATSTNSDAAYVLRQSRDTSRMFRRSWCLARLFMTQLRTTSDDMAMENFHCTFQCIVVVGIVVVVVVEIARCGDENGEPSWKEMCLGRRGDDDGGAAARADDGGGGS
mmetsp:Transcript_2688/g.6779  ORF Transcript_2688/g.6779 Transcript_2688/m.6779 type:complete len:224 (-) Transcript_2688:937-1608(-)